MTTSLWGLTVGDLFRSRVYGTARTYRALSIHAARATISVDGTPGRYAMIQCEMLADPEYHHPRETVWINIVETDGAPLELGGWGGWKAVPMTIIQNAPPAIVQLDLFGMVAA